MYERRKLHVFLFTISLFRLLMFYQVKTETFDDLLMLDDERLDKSKLFFPLEIGLQHD